MRIKTIDERMDEFRIEIFKALCELLKEYKLRISSNFYQFCNIQANDKRIEFLVCAASESYTSEQEILIYYGLGEKRLRKEFIIGGYEVEPTIEAAAAFIKDCFDGKEEPESADGYFEDGSES